MKTGVINPADFLGFQPGEDRKLADWPQIVEYFTILGASSPRICVEELGNTTDGSALLMAIISSPDNLRSLEDYRSVQQRLADPRTIASDQEASRLIAKGRAVVAVTCSIHATEVGATQMSLQAAYHMATSSDENVLRILDNVILLLVPCLNPDGLILVKKWYDATIGTPYEGAFPPFLYHRYTGHDNNRDWFMFTQVETQLLVDRCLNAWRPHVLLDMHQTRSTGMRMVLPPFTDPIGPNVDPILQGGLAMLGTAMAAELTAQGKAGVAVNVVYDAYSPNRAYLHYHGGVRVLSEVASCRIASPVHLSVGQLKPTRDEDPTRKSWNHPMPWKGGVWGLRDIVEYDLAAMMACLDHVARYRETWVRNFYTVGKKAVTYTGNPYAFVIPQRQRDPVAATELLQVLRRADIEVHEAASPFSADGVGYPAGTRVVLSKQPYWSFARTLMETQRYPDLRQYPDGPPLAPYDVTAHCLPLMMGVEAVEVKTPFNATLVPLEQVPPPGGSVGRCEGAAAYALRPESNASRRAINRLLSCGLSVSWAREPVRRGDRYYPPGTFIIEGAGKAEELLCQVAAEESLTFDSLEALPDVAVYCLRPSRVGLYRSHVPATEEGWTRFVLEQYGFQYMSLCDRDIRRGGLEERFDAIMLPHQWMRQIHSGHNSSQYPPEFSGGLGDAGADSLRRFVEAGGTLVAWDGAARYAAQHLELNVANVLAGLPQSDFFCPGSLLSVLLNTNYPIAYGMPDTASAMVVNGPAFEVREGRVVGKYPLHDPLLSGWLIGADKLLGKACVVSVPLGLGEVILMSLRPIFRAQARGTYKLLFNSLLYAAARRVAMPSSLVHGKYVVCKVLDAATSQVIENGAVFQRDGEIIEVGPYADLKARHAPDEEIGGSDYVVLPGLVNAHHHVGLTPFQLGALDAPLETWIIARWQLRDVDPYLDTLYCALQMIESGITTVMHNHFAGRLPVDTGLYEGASSVIRAYEDAGMRVAYSLFYRDQNQLVYEDDARFLSTLPSSLAARLRRHLDANTISIEDYLSVSAELVRRRQSDRTRILVSPHNVHWCSDDWLRAVKDFAASHSVGIHVHVQETIYQKMYGLRHWGKTPLAHLADLGFLGPEVSCAHGVWFSESDIDLLAETGTAVCHNPSSNLRLQSGVAPVNRMLSKGVTVAIGMDEAGINDDNDILQEMRLAHKLHREPGVASDSLTSHQVLHMATEQGARVTSFGDKVGMLEPGKRADMVLLDLNRIREPYLHPDTDIVDALLYRSRGADVDTVIVDGEVLLRNRRFTRVDRQEVVARLRESLERPLSPAEKRRAELSRELLPYVQRWFEDWRVDIRSPHYLYNERT